MATNTVKLIDEMKASHHQEIEALSRERAAIVQAHTAELEHISRSMAELMLNQEKLHDRCARGRTAELEQQIAANADELQKLRLRRENNMGATKQLSRLCQRLTKYSTSMLLLVLRNFI